MSQFNVTRSSVDTVQQARYDQMAIELARAIDNGQYDERRLAKQMAEGLTGMTIGNLWWEVQGALYRFLPPWLVQLVMITAFYLMMRMMVKKGIDAIAYVGNKVSSLFPLETLQTLAAIGSYFFDENGKMPARKPNLFLSVVDDAVPSWLKAVADEVEESLGLEPSYAAAPSRSPSTTVATLRPQAATTQVAVAKPSFVDTLMNTAKQVVSILGPQGTSDLGSSVLSAVGSLFSDAPDNGDIRDVVEQYITRAASEGVPREQATQALAQACLRMRDAVYDNFGESQGDMFSPRD